MRCLVKPFWYVIGAIYYCYKFAIMIFVFLLCLIWSFSIKESVEVWKSEFEYFYTYSIFRGSTIMYQYKTIHDFVNGNKVNKLFPLNKN